MILLVGSPVVRVDLAENEHVGTPSERVLEHGTGLQPAVAVVSARLLSAGPIEVPDRQV